MSETPELVTVYRQGPPGAAATVSLGAVSTLAPGSAATVTEGGTAHARTFTFGIPAGAQGIQGETGGPGPTGLAGPIYTDTGSGDAIIPKLAPTDSVLRRQDWTGTHDLSETAHENHVPYSEAFGSWVIGQAATTTGQPGPDGDTTATLLAETAVSAPHLIQIAMPCAIGANTIGCVVEAQDRRRLVLRESSVSGSAVTYDLVSGTVVGTASGGTGTITELEDHPGWFLITFTFTSAAAAYRNVTLYLLQDAGTGYADRTYLGEAGKGIYLRAAWGNPGATLVGSYLVNATAGTLSAADYSVNVDGTIALQRRSVGAQVYWVQTAFAPASLEARVTALEAPPAVDLCLGPTIYAVAPGTIEASVYFDNLLGPRDATEFRWDLTCTKGQQQAERWTSSGTTLTAGTTTLQVQAFLPGASSAIAAATASLVVAAASAGTGVNRKVLIIGDSTTYSSWSITPDGMAATLVADFVGDPMAITMIGTQGATATKRHEGHPGWKVEDFLGASSPFYSGGAFSFAAYMTANGFTMAASDWVFINLGINDVFGATSDAAASAIVDTMITGIQAMISSIHAYQAGIRIGIALTTPPSQGQDGFGHDYTCVQNRTRAKRNEGILWRGLLTAFSGLEISGKTYIVPLNVCIDTYHNMNRGTAPANSRTAATVERIINGVHPSYEGYQQIADAYYAFLKGHES